MTDIANRVTLPVDERAVAARGFFDVDPAPPGLLPPPTTAVPMTAPALAIPHLPTNVPAAASPAPAANPFAFSPATSPNTRPGATAKTKPRSGGRRTTSWLLMLAVLGGGVYAGVAYGPDLMATAKGEATTSEPEAPLAFPPVVPAAVPPRTATFVVEQPTEQGPPERYELTNDFDTGVSRLFVDRATQSDIELLAVFDGATLRESDQPTWWSMPRGEFPFVGGSERQRWLRTIDEYFPAPMRPFLTIDRSTEAVIGTEAMRHLLVTVDAKGIAGLATDPLTGSPIPAPTLSEFALPAAITGSPEMLEPMAVEVWVDANGMIRKLVEPESMGGRTVTVTSLSPDGYNPTFPAPEVVTPMTAGQLVALAL
jgi:hypothetical protein